jgi:hypothetical protein
MVLPALIVVAAVAAGGPQTAGPPPLELSFERATAKAGESAAIPIYLVSDTNYQEPFQITLEYSASRLTFQKVEPDYLAERAKWKLSASESDHPGKPGRRIVRIDVTPGGSSFFPSGLVARAHFVVSKDTPDGDIPLDAALVAPRGSTPVATATPAKVTVFTTPVFACFFYMH